MSSKKNQKLSGLLEEAHAQKLAIQIATACDCGHSMQFHYFEKDEYGVFVADCKVQSCKCTKFGTDELPGF